MLHLDRLPKIFGTQPARPLRSALCVNHNIHIAVALLSRYYSPMSTIQAARTLLRQSEQELRGLIEAALHEQRYGDVASIADMADGLSRLLASSSSYSKETDPKKVDDSARLAPTVPLTKKGKSGRRGTTGSRQSAYPKFGRAGDRLIKVGWSKKNKREYEHRVPRSAVDALLGKLSTNVAPDQVFEIESVLPLVDQANEEVPAYQVYVTMAWLREVCLVEKKGREGYVISDADAVLKGVDDHWLRLPKR